jgi:para-aminobenzoate synthetase component 1
MNGSEIIDKINRFGQEGIPFIFAVNFDGEEGFVLGMEEVGWNKILFDIGGRKNYIRDEAFILERFVIRPVEFEDYLKAFKSVIYHIRRGDTYLLNLTFPTPIETNLSLAGLFHVSRATYKLLVPGKFVVFSPEIFIRIRNNNIFSYPMKGTIDASEEDAAARILNDRKEFYEHNTIVDLIRNDLAMVSTGVEVIRFRYIEEIHTNRKNLLQVSSEISGRLPGGWRKRLGEILFRLLPAGSVTGAPKKRTVEIIKETELYDRGFYTGIFGHFDGEKLESAVSIRYIEQLGSDMVYKSGGGITAMSDVRSEYEEMVQKVYVPLI